MDSMYSTIMDLPLFKGISKDHVSAFLEKTHVSFVNYGKGERLHDRCQPCRVMRFVISGSVRVSHTHISETCTISEVLTPGSVIGADRLFGMNTEYSSDADAISTVSVMEFSKEQYLKLLASDEIYLINVLNFLSRRAQIPKDFLTLLYSGSLLGNLAFWVSTLTEIKSHSIEIQATIQALSTLTNISQASIRTQLAELRESGLAGYAPGRIKILSRADIINAAIEQNLNSSK
ncbi:MAG: Crp/Fnr family transcriptional regulator [Muribaculaceae bacterium]|nr:Crp/Fnr family transcriptional regulator [Muribaculaceae bacterium]